MSRLMEVLVDKKFKDAEKFYCVTLNDTYEVAIINGKLQYNDNSTGKYKLCHISPKWLQGKYYLFSKEQENIDGLTIDDIFDDERFVNTNEFIHAETGKKYRIQEGVLQYYKEATNEWASRTIDSGIYKGRFRLNSDIDRQAEENLL